MWPLPDRPHGSPAHKVPRASLRARHELAPYSHTDRPDPSYKKDCLSHTPLEDIPSVSETFRRSSDPT